MSEEEARQTLAFIRRFQQNKEPSQTLSRLASAPAFQNPVQDLGSFHKAEAFHSKGISASRVLVAPTPKEAIPPYLRAVTILQPHGDPVAEILAAVAEIHRPPRAGRRFAMLAAGIALLGVLGTAGYLQWQKQRAHEVQASTLTAAAHGLCQSGDHALAWRSFDEAIARYPDQQLLRRAHADCFAH